MKDEAPPKEHPTPAGKVRVEILHDTYASDGPVKAGEIHTLSSRDAEALIGMGKAKPAAD